MSDSVIIGIGNLIRSDDGIGIHVARRLQGMVPDDVEVVEGSVYCADLFGFLEGRRKAIFIDGIDAAEEPGAVFRFSPDKVMQARPAHPISLHDFGVYELIRTATLLDQCPEEVAIFAVQVKNVEFGETLTPEVEAAIDEVCRLVLEELGASSEPDR
jgi:hydrogenase maturation protease